MGWHHASKFLAEFSTDHRILAYVKDFLGDGIEFHQTKYNPKAPKLKGEKWDPHRGDTFWCLKDGVPDSNGLLSVFVALTDQTVENGAMHVWEGSHKILLEEIKPHLIGLDRSQDISGDTASYLSVQLSKEKMQEFDDQFQRVSLIGPAGTVWLMHAGLLHASLENRSGKIRELVANVFRSTQNRPTHPRKETYLSEPANGPL
jgi:ectoine hydroxylase-related dioxygenase (phytanoyl-CoA dioxygenase family)